MKRYLLALLCFVCLNLHAETLRDVLVQNKIPIRSFSQTDLNTRISSGDVKTLGAATFLAFPTLDERGNFSAPIYVVKFDSRTGKIIHKTLSSPQISDVCFGSVLS